MAKAVKEPTIVTLTEPVIMIVKDAAGVETEEEVSVLSIKPPKAGDLRVTDLHKGEVAKSLALITQLSGLPASVIDRLALGDFVAGSEVVQGFLPSGLLNGE